MLVVSPTGNVTGRVELHGLFPSQGESGRGLNLLAVGHHGSIWGFLLRIIDMELKSDSILKASS